MPELKTAEYRLGESVFVRNPERFNPEGASIIGDVAEFELREDGYWYYLAKTCLPAWYAERDIGRRLGTPISRLSGRPGHVGHDRFCAIAASWGHD